MFVLFSKFIYIDARGTITKHLQISYQYFIFKLFPQLPLSECDILHIDATKSHIDKTKHSMSLHFPIWSFLTLRNFTQSGNLWS